MIKCKHYSHHGAATTFPINRRYYNPDMQKAFGGDGMYREYILVVFCNECGQLLDVCGRKATLQERILWRLTGSQSRKYYESLPFDGGNQ